MARLRRLVLRLYHVFRPGAAEPELDRELASHLVLLEDEFIRRGLTSEAACRAARRALGGVVRVKERHRDARSVPWLDDLGRDLHYAVRTLRRAPGFTTVVVLTLALGIGANTAMFSVVSAVLLKPLPYPRSDQLINVSQAQPRVGVEATGWSYANLAALREQNRVFSEVVGSQSHQLTLTGRGEPSVVNTSVVTPELFALFGQTALAGRIFVSEDGKPGASPVVILSEDLWRSSFGADPAIVGSSIDLDKRAFRVVGIMPAAFRFPQLTASDQLWIPLAQDPLFGSWMARRGGHWLRVTGRLKPGVSLAQAQADLDALSARLAADFPAENAGWGIRTWSLQQDVIGNVRAPLLMLLGAVALVLLIACANIANLLLTRATSRARELALRTALGAARTRILRQLLAETAVLGLLGGAAGLAVAYWGVHVLEAFLPPSVPRVNPIGVDHLVLGFAVLLSAIASGTFGVAPALLATNANVQTSLREGGGRSGENHGRRRVRQLLAAGEIALAVVLLVAAGLVLRSFAKLLAVSPGFDVQRIVKADISLPRFQYPTPQQWAAFSAELLARIQAEPGLRDSAVAVPVPIVDGNVNLGFEVIGSAPTAAGLSRTADYVAVSPTYFHMMGVPLLAGRFFDEHDVWSAPRVSVISAALARLYFPNRDPLGRRLSFGFPPDSGAVREIVGIVGDVRDIALDRDPGPMMYVPYAQAPFWGAGVLVKSTLSPGNVGAAIRRDVATIDKDLPVTGVTMLPDLVDASVAQPRFRTVLLALFGAMALVLAATGVFGVLAYSVSCRTHEIGIRVALGASRGTILRMVGRETFLLTLAGLAVGLPAALAVSRLIGHMLFGISVTDPVTLAAVAFMLAAVTALAGAVPARRATRVDPLVALKHD